jgi:hypothetical protein
VAGAVGGQVGAMHISQVGQSRRALDTESGSRGGAQFRAGERGSVIGEADQARVEDSEADLLNDLGYIDAQRLDVHNGLLLSALWDAAFAAVNQEPEIWPVRSMGDRDLGLRRRLAGLKDSAKRASNLAEIDHRSRPR